MSFVNKLKKEDRNIRKHEPAQSTYSISTIDNQKYFQITTYGSESRVTKGSASQSIQFDRESAKDLYDILKREFGF